MEKEKQDNSVKIDGKDFIPIYGYIKEWNKEKTEKLPILGVYNVGYLALIGYGFYPLIKKGLESLF